MSSSDSSTVLSPKDFASAMEQHYTESADDSRQVIVGLKEQSTFADIFRKYQHLYTKEQADSLARERGAATDPENLKRLWYEAADALAQGEMVQVMQDLWNDRLAWRAEWDGEETSLNTLGALAASDTDFDRREAIFALMNKADAEFAERELELKIKVQDLRSEVFGMDGEIAMAEDRMGIDIRRFSQQILDVCDRTASSYAERAARIFPELLHRAVDRPSRAHAQYMRSLHIYDGIYTQDAMVKVCSDTLSDLGFPLAEIPTILPDLEDRPQKSPRACVIPVKVPDEVHLVVRPTGGITDYQAFLHEAGHALHFGLTDSALPFAYRDLSPDHALTEIYSFVVERITHSPAWHVRHFGVDEEQAHTTCEHIRFIDATLFRRYAAKLKYELEFWSNPSAQGLSKRYSELLSEQTLMTYPEDSWVSDMDPGLYAADYLRAWRTSEQVIAWLRKEFGEEWFADRRAGDMLLDLFRQGTRPTNEEVCQQIGTSPDNFDDLIRQLS